MQHKHYFTRKELLLWSLSTALILLSYCLFDRGGVLRLIASLIGIPSLLLGAKGNPLGQVLIIGFSLIYGYISYTFAYYGEMITYLGMTLPMAVIALISWVRHPYNGNHAEVEVGTLTKNALIFMVVSAAAVTAAFYFILRAFHTANLIPSTISVTTSYMAVYLAYKRSPYFAAAYAANDLILIVLWVLASLSDTHYLSVVVCFAMFFINDIYGFLNWCRMRDRQAAGA